MARRAWFALLVALGGCSYPALPQLSSDAATNGDGSTSDGSISDAPVDAPMALTVSVSVSSFTLHVNDTRETQVTVTNTTGQPIGAPSLQATGLTLGMLTFASNTCTTTLAPGGMCTATGQLTATAEGQITFSIVATATPDFSAMASLSATVMPACPANCGPAGNANCCASSVVPGNATGATLAGTSFYRSYDVATDGMYPSMIYPATVSDFRLDTYEVTVGRFRKFVDAGFGTQAMPPAAGAGARRLNGMVGQGGWDPSWNASLAADTAALKAAVKCDASYQTWMDTADFTEQQPMNCITWYEAMAFCIWDGGYLPTEAEWNYAASGGSEQRAYPWSIAAGSLTIDETYASYYVDSTKQCFGDGVNGCSRYDIVFVGTKPAGDGRWGHADLGGNLLEWNLDWHSVYPTPCNDCASLTAASYREIRGGNFRADETVLRTGYRHIATPSDRFFGFGVRCARTP